MKSTVEQLSPTRVRINVEVPFDELKPNFDRAYHRLAQQVRIPGFRPGKAPARILESRIGRSAVLDEVVNEAVPAKYSEAISGGEVHPIGRPDIEVTKVDDGQLLTFTAEVDVRPDIAIPDFADFAVTVDDLAITDAEVSEQLELLRTRFGTLTDADRPVRHGDYVVIDLAATVDGEAVEEGSTSGMSYEVGSDQLVEGIDEALLGATAGETRTFTTELVAGEFVGREAEVSVTVSAVKERELPEVDDEFAQEASEFDTLEELEADIRDRLGKVKRTRRGGQARDKVLAALLDATEVPLPPAVVAAETEVREHDTLRGFEHDQDRLNSFLAEQGETREQFDAELRSSAEEAVKTHLVLDAVADAGQLTVSDTEMTERILFQAQRFGISPEDYVQRAQQAGQLGAIFADVRRGKALATVVRAAAITDASGNPVDIAEFYGPAEPPVAEEAGAVVEGGVVEGAVVEGGIVGGGTATPDAEEQVAPVQA